MVRRRTKKELEPSCTQSNPRNRDRHIAKQSRLDWAGPLFKHSALGLTRISSELEGVALLLHQREQGSGKSLVEEHP